MDLCQVMLSGKSKRELKRCLHLSHLPRLLLRLVFDGQPGRKNEKRTFSNRMGTDLSILRSTLTCPMHTAASPNATGCTLAQEGLTDKIRLPDLLCESTTLSSRKL